MKRLLAVVAAVFCFMGAVFADETSDAFDIIKPEPSKETVKIVPENQYPELHPTSKSSCQVYMEYTPLTNEVHIYYTCNMAAYDQGEAMNTVMAILKDFQKENGYYSYRYMRKDSVKYFRDEANIKKATYSSYLVFSR
ncbi:MAG: hypothetical protein J6Y93_03035 [Treponema sp.]|nr:hypothetical protein [Treponema sp.]